MGTTLHDALKLLALGLVGALLVAAAAAQEPVSAAAAGENAVNQCLNRQPNRWVRGLRALLTVYDGFPDFSLNWGAPGLLTQS